MTNTLHRQGTVEELKGDYVIFATTARGITREGSAPKIQEFLRICQKYNPINVGSSRQGNILQDKVDIQELIANLGDGAGAAAVFTNLDALQGVISELIKADLGISINVSGLLDGVQQCCRNNATERHSVEQSLGFWGSRDRLPEREILTINTLCGHGLVSFNLIHKMIEYVKMRRLTPREAAKIMGKCCECGVFNIDRAEHLLENMLET
ncbi:MAG: hypothetical protein PVJ38_03010 [Candidatus Bathyarchaeota archaeon]|jgi:hypothetical protein